MISSLFSLLLLSLKFTIRDRNHSGCSKRSCWLAKEVASLDMLSGGRLEFGIGYGWCVEEMRNHGLDYKKRRGIFEDNILLMKELWTQDEASYSGGT